MSKKNAADIEKWQNRIRVGVEERKAKQPKWDDLLHYFRNGCSLDWKSVFKSGYQIVTVNLVYSTIKVVVPSVYPKNPKIYFEATQAATVDQAKLNEAIFNKDMRGIHLKETNKRIIQDVVLLGTGFSKTTFEIEDYNYDNQDVADNLMERFTERKADAITGDIAIPESGPRVVRVAPKDLVTALGVTDFDDPGFIAHHVRKRLSKIKKDKFYKNTRNLQPTYKFNDRLLSDLPSGFLAGMDDEMFQMVDMWEIWDVEDQNWFVIAENHSEYLVDPRDNIFPYDHPFDRLVYTELDDQIWGLGEVEPWLPQQDELNLYRTQRSNHVKRYNRKYIIRKGLLESPEEDMAKFEAGEDGVALFARANTQGVPLGDIIDTIKDAPMPADALRHGIEIEDDIVKIARVTPYRRGGTVGANTATEANIAEGAAQIGDTERLDYNADFTLRQMEKIRKARKKFTEGAEILDVTGDPLDENRWQTWQKSDIDVDSEMRVEFGPDRPLTQDARIMQALQLYDRAMANPTVNPQSAFVELANAFDIRDLTKWFLPQMIIQMQMLQKAMGAAKDQGGISPMGPMGGTSNGSAPGSAKETPAELRGRAAPALQT